MVTALYRRYRPESFADVIGQDHVTEPLMRALRNNRIGHAYLFSGPRGCGKTTSARILARCLNCAAGPTDTPCGHCDSCRDLARGGPGSLDVVEIDAASHGGVDDARELRERATFAPARDRYKIFIIDEAHMVTSAGFNALLKLVEEPPDHVKFVFATTEPDKVIGTIRSRTHHYPFRLIPPQVLTPYLEQVCSQEGVPVGTGVLPLVVRAGGGSARDTLSVLDQLMAGAGGEGIDYPMAVSLLGFTDAELLDRAVEAIAAGDASSLYGAVEQVIGSGQEPRRFVEDVLERLRDLIILAAVPDRGADLLPEVPADQLSRMMSQAEVFGPAELSRCGDIVNDALSTMTGATSPRLHLELLCARLLLSTFGPGAGAMAANGLASASHPTGLPQHRGAESGAGRSSGRQASSAPDSSFSQNQTAAPASPVAPAVSASPVAPAPPTAEMSNAQGVSGRERARQIARERAESARRAREATPGAAPTSALSQVSAPAGHPVAEQHHSSTPAPAQAPKQALDDGWGEVARIPGSSAGSDNSSSPHDKATQPHGTSSSPQGGSAQGQNISAQQPADVTPTAPTPPGAGADRAEELRGHWSALMGALHGIRRPSWALISQNAQPHAFDGQQLVLGFRSQGLVDAFGRGTAADNMAQAVRQILHLDVTVTAMVADGSTPSAVPSRQAAPARTETTPATPEVTPPKPQAAPTRPDSAPARPEAASMRPAADPAKPEAAPTGTEPAQIASPPRGGTPRYSRSPIPDDLVPPLDDQVPPPDDQVLPPDDQLPPPEDDWRPSAQASARPSAQASARPSGHCGDQAAGQRANRSASSASSATSAWSGPLPESVGRDGLGPDHPRTHGASALRAAIKAHRDGNDALLAAAQELQRVAQESHAQPQAAQSVNPPANRPVNSALNSPATPPLSSSSPMTPAAPSAGTPSTSVHPSATATPRMSGAALAREAARESARAGLRHQALRSQEALPEDEDPTGGASPDDADAGPGAITAGREVIATVLGGKVLEVIDTKPGE
ncbi:DNA polymerase III subunit gamma and tau [Devriesea agamarum]|uniref:DNA polymerase III subunit gamma and tau n=1 Tax=Devriesea agamarum TaxID=472569 RepID=UPI00082BEFEA|nr:DNA polymerase III subunit gamma and tau [Devriesea agamarum]